jgi:hypothetical protein
MRVAAHPPVGKTQHLNQIENPESPKRFRNKLGWGKSPVGLRGGPQFDEVAIG